MIDLQSTKRPQERNAHLIEVSDVLSAAEKGFGVVTAKLPSLSPHRPLRF